MRTALGDRSGGAPRRAGCAGGLLFKLLLTPVLLIVLLAILYLGMSADEKKSNNWSVDEFRARATGSDRGNMHPDELLEQAEKAQLQSEGEPARPEDVAGRKRLPVNQQLHELKMDLDQQSQQREDDIRARINAATGGKQ